VNILLSPHNDDEVLFAAYSIMRMKPLVIVVTDSVRHLERYGITAEDRRKESITAMEILEAPVMFLGIPDDKLCFPDLQTRLKNLKFNGLVYAPAITGGNDEHDTVGAVAISLWADRAVQYMTYTKDNPKSKGSIKVDPIPIEIDLKNKALQQYKSQLRINKIYFDAAFNAPEYYA
jgi:LmbE family N-acetylglucosaminyl deacetylase